MELFGYPIETIFLYSLFICGGLTLLYILFGDILDHIAHAATGGFLSPTLVLSFLTIFSGLGYVFEKVTPLNIWSVVGISAAISFILVTLLNVFVLIPLSSAEESVGYKNEDLKGRIGKVITPIPIDGLGHVVIKGTLGNISKRAKSFDNVEVPYGTKVIVIDVKDGVLYVSKQPTELE